MKKYFKDRYDGCWNIVLDISLAITVILLCTKLLGASYSFAVIAVPLLLFSTLSLIWYLVFVYCMTYQHGSSFLKDSKKYIKSKLKVFVK